ncbi:MAG TPA: ATP-dependent Clp protease adaptor ClpS [Phycisphaerales bacterium]|nr:ATP-dependent Clp protease adaptor ClpS [Phycisphaerales bacterium]
MSHAQTQTLPARSPAPPAQPRWWNVVLLDSPAHTYEHVIRMMQEVFRHTPERAYLLAKAVDTQGRVICLTTHKEHAELKRDQVHAYGADPLIPESKGSMSALIEPALGGGEGPDEGTPRNGSDGPPA